MKKWDARGYINYPGTVSPFQCILAVPPEVPLTIHCQGEVYLGTGAMRSKKPEAFDLEKNVTTTSLEMLSQTDFRPKSIDRENVRVDKVEIPTPTLSHFFFVNVGRPWKWYSRLGWTLSDWRTWVEKENVHTFVGYMKGSPFGYIELDQQGESIEIAFFGLLPQFIGHGLGGFLLSEAIRLAWQLNPQRVWVHTCTQDHKHSLDNYLARGFAIYQKVTIQERIPDDNEPIWSTPDYYRSIAEEYQDLSHQIAESM
jgi:GNAT superfamily N-acetyltransferase